MIFPQPSSHWEIVKERMKKCLICIILKLCIVFVLSLQLHETFFILSHKQWLQNSLIDGCLYSHHLFTWYYTDFLRRTWFDFAYCCKLIDKNSTLFVVTNLLSLPSCLTLYWFCKEKLSFDHCCRLMAQKLNIICNNYNYDVLFCYRFRDINLSLQSGC